MESKQVLGVDICESTVIVTVLQLDADFAVLWTKRKLFPVPGAQRAALDGNNNAMFGSMLKHIIKLCGVDVAQGPPIAVFASDASWGDSERRQLRDVGQAAGLDARQIINRHAAVLMVHGYYDEHKCEEETTVLVVEVDNNHHLSLYCVSVEIAIDELVGSCTVIPETDWNAAKTVVEALRVLEAKVGPRKYSEVLLAGKLYDNELIRAQVQSVLPAPLVIKEAPGVELAGIVSYGCALKAQHLARPNAGAGFEVIFTTAFNYGVSVCDGRVISVLAYNCTIPVNRSVWFTTSVDNQRTACIDVYEGVRPQPAECAKLTENPLVLRDLPSCPAGELILVVDMFIDKAQTLTVQAYAIPPGGDPKTDRLSLQEMSIPKLLNLPGRTVTFVQQKHGEMDAARAADSAWFDSLESRLGLPLGDEWRTHTLPEEATP